MAVLNEHLRALAIPVSLAAALVLVVSVARADEAIRIPVVFHVAEREGAPVSAEAFIAEQLAAANAIYGPLGIELVERERLRTATKHADLLTRAQRDALAGYFKDGVINCFVVAKLMDVDEVGRERRGVHWRPRHSPRRSFLIVSRISGRYVLAHELGHYWGNQKHSDVAGNLMSYKRADGPPFLDGAQVLRVQQTLASMLKRGTIVRLGAGQQAGSPK